MWNPAKNGPEPTGMSALQDGTMQNENGSFPLLRFGWCFVQASVQQLRRLKTPA
jgi:hypothetical protein